MIRKCWRYTLSSLENKFFMTEIKQWVSKIYSWYFHWKYILSNHATLCNTSYSTSPTGIFKLACNHDLSFPLHVAFLSPGNKHLFPFINFTSTLQVPTGRRWYNLYSLIKCRTLVLRVCCSHFSLREAGALNILLCQPYQLGNKAVFMLQTCSNSVDLVFHVICLPWTLLRQLRLTSVSFQPLPLWPQLSRCQVGFRWQVIKVFCSGWKEKRHRL